MGRSCQKTGVETARVAVGDRVAVGATVAEGTTWVGRGGVVVVNEGSGVAETSPRSCPDPSRVLRERDGVAPSPLGEGWGEVVSGAHAASSRAHSAKRMGKQVLKAGCFIYYWQTPARLLATLPANSLSPALSLIHISEPT